jgi:hypothetical protein
MSVNVIIYICLRDIKDTEEYAQYLTSLETLINNNKHCYQVENPKV